MTQLYLDLFETHRTSWLARARSIAYELAQERGQITIDDVRERLPPPSEVDPRVMGAVFSKKIFECIGYQKSIREECHRRPVRLFRLRSL